MNFSNSYIKSISTHLVGNKSKQQEIVVSKEPLNLSEDLSIRLRDYFLGHFSNVLEKYRFSHRSSIKYNEIFNYSKEIFANDAAFHQVSIKIANHLYDNSVYAKIKKGELHICLFKGCIIENREIDIIGIFKSENKNGFFQIKNLNSQFGIEYKEGVDINKIDKGCLILNIESEQGFQVLIVDSQNRGNEAQYWRDDFLGLNQINNDFYQTNHFLSLTKSFITEQLDKDSDLSSTDKFGMLNRSIEYFKVHDSFDKEEFEKEVFDDTYIVDSFRSFDSAYRQTNDIRITDNFNISQQAVKKQARIFKSVLKLDNNFQIHIRGNQGMIEKGVEKDGRKYYKIYYDVES